MPKAVRERATGGERGAHSSSLAVAGSPAAAASGAPPPREDRDPLAAVLDLGSRAARVGAIVGLTLALTSHGALSGQAVLSGMLREIRLITRQMRGEIHDYLWAMYDVDLTPPEKKLDPPKPEPEEETQEPEPPPKVEVPKNTPPPKDDPYEPPPAAAAAPKVLTQEPDPNEIVDMTSFGIASGTGDGPGYGMVAGEGTAKTATKNPNARIDGTPGGKGTGDPRPPPPPPPTGPDRSRQASFSGSSSWNCPFPPEADAEDINLAYVTIAVTVRPDGSPLSVKVVSDPGNGFGRAARLCALQRKYSPGLDRDGNPITSTIPAIKVKFTR